MKHIKTLRDIGKIGGIGIILAFGLVACNNSDSNTNGPINESINKQGATVFIEKNPNGTYKIVDEFPSNETRIFLRELDSQGVMNERLLSKEEIDKLVKEENAKIDSGTSDLTKQNASVSSGGMGLGEVILASAAGAIIGSWIGGKLFNSPNYQNQRQSAYKNPSTYNKSVSSFNKANAARSAGKSGFFGKNSAGKTSNFGG